MRVEREYGPGDGLGERPLGELLRELLREGQGLVREEVRLATAEAKAEAKKAAKGGGTIAAGGALLYAALLLLGVTLILVLDTFLPAWLAALVVTAIYAVAGYVAVNAGKKALKSAEPSRAVESIKEDGRWAKETMRDIRSRRSVNA